MFYKEGNVARRFRIAFSHENSFCPAEHLQATHRKDLFIKGLEAIWLQVKFPSTSVLFSVMYRQPDDNEFFNLLRCSLEKT